MQLFADQTKLVITARQLFFRRRITQQFVGSAIPQHHAAFAVAFRNHAFEIAVIHRMIFHVHG